jgi:SAM-dependent methyltransferase
MSTDWDAIYAAEASLRPSAQAATEAWRVLVEAEKQQVESLPNRPRPEDFYAPVATAFRDDPRRTNDLVLELLLPLVGGSETWLDLGAGGGRYTLPVALRARFVYAVEPSAGMREVLQAGAREHGIYNLDVFAERWPSTHSEAPIADVGFMSQVGYDIADIGPFLDQLEAHSRRLCVAVLYDRSPITDLAPLWQPVHGEPRVRLPALRELTALLFARGADVKINGVPLPPRTFASVEALHEAARRPLWVLPDTPEDARLGAAVRALAQPVRDGVGLVTRPQFLAVVTWQPALSKA